MLVFRRALQLAFLAISFFLLISPTLAQGSEGRGIKVTFYFYEEKGYWVYHNLFVFNRTGFNNTEYIGFEGFRRTVSEWNEDVLRGYEGSSENPLYDSMETCLRVAGEKLELRLWNLLRSRGVRFGFVNVWRDVVWIVVYRSSFERDASLIMGLRNEIAKVYMEVMASEPHEVEHPDLGVCRIGWPRKVVETAVNGTLKIVIEKPLADPYIGWSINEYMRGEEPPKASDLLDLTIPPPPNVRGKVSVDVSTVNREGILWFYVAMHKKNETVLKETLDWIRSMIRGGLKREVPARVYIDIMPEEAVEPLVITPKLEARPVTYPPSYKPPSIPSFLIPVIIFLASMFLIVSIRRGYKR